MSLLPTRNVGVHSEEHAGDLTGIVLHDAAQCMHYIQQFSAIESRADIQSDRWDEDCFRSTFVDIGTAPMVCTLYERNDQPIAYAIAVDRSCLKAEDFGNEIKTHVFPQGHQFHVAGCNFARDAPTELVHKVIIDLLHESKAAGAGTLTMYIEPSSQEQCHRLGFRSISRVESYLDTGPAVFMAYALVGADLPAR